ncbi:hypothetical protein [Conexibacter sp. CPCC 206217]|uniref:hypothetical protein n=1 Tax=Conexibacter sp. CPCC 206217 TaxID=3064574 RepID=UPI00271DCD86|nr:hypothetical protein [Conexibacter sp. CPCC 206217]MDO8213516.1 hypothetical protein [Conexibacter sp. CPCC 206217]
MIGLKAVDGASWIRAYSTDTVPSTVFAATEDDGIYRSVNNGITWSDFSSGLTTPGQRVVQVAGGGQPGGDVPRRAVADHVKPRLSGASITRGSFKAGAKGVQLRFRLSERATLWIAVVKLAKRRGTAGKTVGTLVAKVGTAGAGHVAFNGRIGRRTLAAGGYKLVVTPVDAAGNRGRAVTLAFRTVRR